MKTKRLKGKRTGAKSACLERLVRWVSIYDIELQSPLKYSRIECPETPSIKWMVEDVKAERAWLMHATMAVTEGWRVNDEWHFGYAFST